MRCLLVGNYGIGNWGDEMLMEYFLARYPEIDWTVVHRNPSKLFHVPRLPLKPDLIFFPWWKTIAALATVDAVVFGGGSLFVSNRKQALMYAAYAFVAWVFRTPTFYAFQGIGPTKNAVSRMCTRFALRNARFISVRDEISAERCPSYVSHIVPVCSFDPVPLLLTGNESQKKGTRLVIIPRKDGNMADSFMSIVQRRRKEIPHESMSVVLLESGASEEMRAAHAIVDACADEQPSIIPVFTFDDLVTALDGACAVLTTRYHGVLMAYFLDKEAEPFYNNIGGKGWAFDHEVIKKHVPKEVLIKKALAGEEALKKALADLEV